MAPEPFFVLFTSQAEFFLDPAGLLCSCIPGLRALSPELPAAFVTTEGGASVKLVVLVSSLFFYGDYLPAVPAYEGPLLSYCTHAPFSSTW